MAEAREYRQVRYTRPEGATEIVLVRHGESAPAREDTPFGSVDGHGDPPLHPDGEEQARKVADRLAVEDIDAIYVTSLQRTHQTAAPLVARTGIEPIVEPDLREVFLGEWELGPFRKYVDEKHPIAVRMVAEERWDVIPGAEPSEQFAARVRAGINRVASKHRDQCVVVFTHGGVIGQVLADAAQSRPFAFTGADNGSISHLVVAGDRWIIRRFNDTTHLHPAFTTISEPLT